LPRGVRAPGLASFAASSSLRTGDHRAAGVPLRLVPGRAPGRAARGCRVQPDAHVVPALVRQPGQPVVRGRAAHAAPRPADVPAAPLERRGLRGHHGVRVVRGRRRYGHGTAPFREPPSGRRDAAPERVLGVPEHALQFRRAQADSGQLQRDRRHSPETTPAFTERKNSIIKCVRMYRTEMKTL